MMEKRINGDNGEEQLRKKSRTRKKNNDNRDKGH